MKKSFVFILSLVFVSQFSYAQKIISTNTVGQATEVIMEVDGLERQFIIHTPNTYNPQEKVPLVFMFHGGGGTGKRMYRISGWKELGNQKGFLSVYPTAYKTCIIKDGIQETKNFWMTNSKLRQLCSNQAAHSDVKFVDLMLDYMITNYAVKENRVYASGFSNGCGLTLSKIVPELSHRFAATGTVGSLVRDSFPYFKKPLITPPVKPVPKNPAVKPIQVGGPQGYIRDTLYAKDPIPVFLMIGEVDHRLMVHNGGQPFPTNEIDFVGNTFLTNRLGTCVNMLNLDGTHTNSKDTPKFFGVVYDNALDGGDQFFRFGVMKGLDHIWPYGQPGSNGIKAAKVFWDFFKKHQK